MEEVKGYLCPSEGLNTSQCQYISLKLSNPDETLNLDYGSLASYWSVAFTSVFLLYLFSHGIGVLLKFIRNS